LCNQQIEACLVLRTKTQNRRSDFEAYITKSELPVLRPKLGNPPPPWFWGSTKKPTAGFEAKPRETVPTSFEAKLEKTVAAGFDAKPVETITTGFDAKPAKTVRVVLRPNRWKPSQWFWGQTGENCLHVHGADRTRRYPTSRPPGHRVPDLCDHPQSSTLGLLLLPQSSSLHVMLHLPPAHHETSKRDSPNETKVKEKQNKIVSDLNSNLTKSMTHQNQTKELTTWFLRLPCFNV
jgi:hypothetical protein